MTGSSFHRLLTGFVTMALLVPATALAEDLRVMTSAGFYSVYAELGPEFERTTGHHLITSRGPSMEIHPSQYPIASLGARPPTSSFSMAESSTT